MQMQAKNSRKRNRNPEINQPDLNTPITITEAEAAGSVLTLTFSGIVALERGVLPGITTDVAGAEPVGIVQTSPNVVEVTYSASIAAATTLNIPFRDPAIRNASGGYVVSNTFPLAA
jgi:hypothetical protein